MIETTWSHPFYIRGKGWVKAEDLVEGDVSQTEGNGSLKTTKIHVDVRGEEVYNFEVEEDHNYYVSEAGVLVHNEGPKYREFANALPYEIPPVHAKSLISAAMYLNSLKAGQEPDPMIIAELLGNASDTGSLLEGAMKLSDFAFGTKNTETNIFEGLEDLGTKVGRVEKVLALGKAVRLIVSGDRLANTISLVQLKDIAYHEEHNLEAQIQNERMDYNKALDRFTTNNLNGDPSALIKSESHLAAVRKLEARKAEVVKMRNSIAKSIESGEGYSAIEANMRSYVNEQYRSPRPYRYDYSELTGPKSTTPAKPPILEGFDHTSERRAQMIMAELNAIRDVNSSLKDLIGPRALIIGYNAYNPIPFFEVPVMDNPLDHNGPFERFTESVDRYYRNSSRRRLNKEDFLFFHHNKWKGE